MKLEHEFGKIKPDDTQKQRMFKAVLEAQREYEKKGVNLPGVKLAAVSLGLLAVFISAFAAYNAVKRDSDDFKSAADGSYSEETKGYPEDAAETFEPFDTLIEEYREQPESTAMTPILVQAEAGNESYTAELEQLKELYMSVRDVTNYYLVTDGVYVNFDEERYENDVNEFLKLQRVAVERFYSEILPSFSIPVEEGQYEISQNFFEDAAVSHNHHLGQDFAADIGTEIYAAADGTVMEVNKSDDYNGYGRYIEVDHGNGVTTLYSQCSEIIAVPGQTIEQGDLIALVGETGWATGPHLHFELRIDGLPFDPMMIFGG